MRWQLIAISLTPLVPLAAAYYDPIPRDASSAPLTSASSVGTTTPCQSCSVNLAQTTVTGVDTQWFVTATTTPVP
ncbi:hypothetical protein PHLGIDRAFT_254656 [Phlebiopsis gigantea 11061_1 CR5-6]|uniref:Uncharacterized protein n=1 Tax=Phlebiopsis gigantea (strain 11061_1 CR5-6) TaxID=745531 RepID=A0A0C3S1G6_PHLG1|nr:hypothetical protein PHLGIDRAFT_254656 [Phlebiopsis gigantea 11061_1 CR5-6]